MFITAAINPEGVKLFSVENLAKEICRAFLELILHMGSSWLQQCRLNIICRRMGQDLSRYLVAISGTCEIWGFRSY